MAAQDILQTDEKCYVTFAIYLPFSAVFIVSGKLFLNINHATHMSALNFYQANPV